MRHAVAEGDLENKTIEELRAMLADDELLPLDDDANADLILKITEVIIKKEGKTAEQRETELESFWTGLLSRHGDKIPIRLDDVVRKQKRRFPANRLPVPKAARILAAAVLFVIVLLAGNTIAVNALNVNILQAIVGFSDEWFNKTILSPESPGSVVAGDMDPSKYASYQEALNDLGIVRPKAPGWLPDGFHFVSVEIGKLPDRTMILAIYENSERVIIVKVISYSQPLQEFQRSFAKDAGPPESYWHNGIEHYIFFNQEKTVATWLDGMSDCDIQGDISVAEIKAIINSMATEK
jgi:hypothetical protein